jgi:long-chain acyl-CoA synthetase
MQTISEMIDSLARYEPDHIAVVFGDQHIAYKDLNCEANRLANGLLEMGIRPRDRVLLFMKNSLRLVTAYYALIRAGATIVPLNTMYRAHEIGYIGKDTAASVIIADDELWNREASVKDDLPDLKYVILHGADTSAGTESFDQVISQVETTPQVKVDLDSIVSIIYTSGTTGRPKGATQTHRSILSNVGGCSMRNKFCRNDRLLCALPLFNNFAINVVMMSAFANGATLIVIDRFEARKVLDSICAHKCTYFAGTPTMFSYLLQEYDDSKDDVQSLRVTNSGGSHCPGNVVREIEETFGTIHLDGYGQTEGCGFTILNPLVGVRKENSVGTPLSNIWLKIVDDNDRELPVGKIGEIVERGDAFSIHGYWKRPDVNKETYRSGWFHSGDLGYLDKDGYLYVVDRKQDLIITGGANIYPAEVEEVLYSHPKVALAAVIGVPDELKGELAKAYIVLKKGETATERELIEYVRSHIAKYKAPRMVEFADSLPQGPTGKILKRELRDLSKDPKKS